MALEQPAERLDSKPRPRRGRNDGVLARALRQLFSVPDPARRRQRVERAPPDPMKAQPTPPPPDREPLEHTLARFESMPGELADLKRTLGDVLHRFEDTLDHLGIEARRLSSESSSLALMADQLQARLGDLNRLLGENGRYRDWGPAPAPEHAPERTSAMPEEPQFRPSDQGVEVVLAAVPGFQGLMDAQRALNGLAAADGASVAAFRNGEASLRLVLRQPASARQIVEGLSASTGQQIVIEEARPEAQRLRLRFVNGEGRR